MHLPNAASPVLSPHPSGLTDVDERYESFLGCLHTRFSALAPKPGSLFFTDARRFVNKGSLFDLFLSKLPPERRQHYTCTACRSFVETYGSMVMVDEEGTTHPVLWGNLDQVPIFFLGAVTALRRLVMRATILRPVLVSESPWGLPSNKDENGVVWHHMHVLPGEKLVYRAHLHPEAHQRGPTPTERMGEVAQGHDMIERSVGEFTAAHLTHAIALLDSDKLDRPERALPMATWFLDLLGKLDGVKDERRRNALYWLAASMAPVAFTHFRNNMLGKLLTDIKDGVPQQRIIEHFNDKMDPLNYQQPKAPLSEGAISAAEKRVEQMGLAPALRRRFLRFDEVIAIWRPKAETNAPPKDGVFSHLRGSPAAKSAPKEMPTRQVTWRTFRERVLPTADRMEFVVPREKQGFFMFVTAEDEKAPPILQWDLPSQRNPVSWYFRYEGAFAPEWNLTPGTVVAVRAITVAPPHWHDEAAFSHLTKGAFFILDGARDVVSSQGGGFFPEILRTELHSVRATMAVFGNTAMIAGREQADANGVAFTQQENARPLTVRVYHEQFVTTYVIDRWE